MPGHAVSGTEQLCWPVTTETSGRRYLARAILPPSRTQQDGSGLLIVLDGDAYLSSAVEMVRAHSPASDVVVATLGYPDDPAWIDGVLARHQPLSPLMANRPRAQAACQLERFFDLSLPASQAVLDAESVPGMFSVREADVGGLDVYIDLISQALIPRIEADYGVDQSRIALFGHSLGGLAALHALFTRPGMATSFIASSPSIWWNRRAVLAGEAAFTDRVKREEVSARLLIAVGGEEAHLPVLPPWLGVDPARLKRAVRTARMVGNARDLARRLGELGNGLDVAPFLSSPGLGHALAPFAALARGVAFAFSGGLRR